MLFPTKLHDLGIPKHALRSSKRGKRNLPVRNVCIPVKYQRGVNQNPSKVPQQHISAIYKNRTKSYERGDKSWVSSLAVPREDTDIHDYSNSVYTKRYQRVNYQCFSKTSKVSPKRKHSKIFERYKKMKPSKVSSGTMINNRGSEHKNLPLLSYRVR